jgi:ATP-dependent Lon protease
VYWLYLKGLLMSDNEPHVQLDMEEESNQDTDSSSPGALILPSDALPERIYLLPIHNRPYFPAQIQPLMVSKKRWQDTLERLADTEHHTVGLCYVGDINPEEISHEDFSAIGCAAKVHKVSVEGAGIQFLAQGLKRFRIVRWLSKEAPYLVEVEYPPETDSDGDEVRAYTMAIINAIKELLPLNPLYGEELKNYLNHFDTNEASPLADFASALTSSEGDSLQDILDTLPVLERMKKVLPLLQKELEVAQLQSKIREEVNQQVSESQRTFFLKEQLKIIQKELGIAKDDKTAEIDEFKERIDKLVLPEQVAKRIDDELQKLSILETGSAEYGVTRNYLDWITSLPWGLTVEDNLDLKHAREVLSQEHDGLDDVKERILEFLAEGSFKGEVSGSILLLVGPPGVGKTSIGHSIADALGRPFYRFSVGGMRDEAEIKGHRRTYVGAMPGKLVQALKDVELSNPVIMLDEIDKIGSSYQGDPASALLEVLDPEQNSSFNDHYLEVDYDLSDVMFVATSNSMDIPGPLLDRMEVIRLSGYTEDEKLNIAKNHLLNKQIERNGLKNTEIEIEDSAIIGIIRYYTREAGVRALERDISKLCRKAVKSILLDKKVKKVTISQDNLSEFLGVQRFDYGKADDENRVGLVTGLAWTQVGGELLTIETASVPGKGKLSYTGSLGDVMQESIQAAMTVVRSRTEKLRINDDFYEKRDIHVHVPEGATPKDGPSAGIGMCTALVSSLTGNPVKADVAMTGEITLRGEVLAIGGLKEKLLAAHRGGIKTVVIPKDNERDLKEIPDNVKADLAIYPVKWIDEVLKIALEHPVEKWQLEK